MHGQVGCLCTGIPRETTVRCSAVWRYRTCGGESYVVPGARQAQQTCVIVGWTTPRTRLESGRGRGATGYGRTRFQRERSELDLLVRRGSEPTDEMRWEIGNWGRWRCYRGAVHESVGLAAVEETASGQQGWRRAAAHGSFGRESFRGGDADRPPGTVPEAGHGAGTH